MTSKYQIIEESVMSSLAKMGQTGCDNPDINDFADNSLIAMGSMTKALYDLEHVLDASPDTVATFRAMCKMWKDLCSVAINEVSDMHL